MEDCVSWSEGEWKINPNCCFKRWLIIKGRSLRMILIHKRLMVSLKRSHAIRKILEKSGPSFIYIRRALSEPLHATHSGKCVYISYLRAASVKDEYTNMESQSYFFLLFTFILMNGQVEFLCLQLHSKQLNKPQKNWQIYSFKGNKIIFFISQMRYGKRSGFWKDANGVSSHSFISCCLFRFRLF